MRHSSKLRLVSTGLCLVVLVSTSWAADKSQEVISPISERFQTADVEETPSFQKHVVPLFGRLGCNGRACHGSFQGRGGFRLSLFGYDFKSDLEALIDEESPRIDTSDPLDSLILIKPTDEDMHEGGQRYQKDSWQYHVLSKWIQAGAEFDADKVAKLDKLEVTPSEIVFGNNKQQRQLRVIARWSDGSREDVTELCRFQTNDDQIATISEQGLVSAKEAGDTHVVVFYDNGVVPIPVMRPVSALVGRNYPKVKTATAIDGHVVAKLRKIGIVPSDICSDEEFIRRVSLDLAGTLPSAQEVETFLADSSANKRAKKIDALLETPAYAAWWTTQLCDYTGNNDQQLANALPRVGNRRYPAANAWYEWIYKRVQENSPYDELIAGIVTSASRQPGQSFREYCEEMSAMYRGEDDKSFADMASMPYYWARRDFRQPEERAINFAYAFMGIRIQCAQCHKHPFDQWSKQDFEQFTAFFGQTTFTNNRPSPASKEEYDAIVEALDIDKKLRGGQLRRKMGELLEEGKTVPFPEVYVNNSGYEAMRQRKGKNAKPSNSKAVAKLLGSDEVDLNQVHDPRKPLMDWLAGRDNPYFARAFVNRVWASYFNVGIVDPPDDLSLANPPSNKPLLDYLAQGFIDNGFDMKWVHREILNSDTYQRAWKPNETNSSDERNFSRAVPRRLPAEVAFDAIVQATSADSQANQMCNVVEGRAVSIPASSGRNLNVKVGGTNAGFALAVFGRSTRESNCDCDRTTDPSLLQTVFLQNDSDIFTLIDREGGWLREIAREHGWEKRAQPKPKRPANYDRRVTAMQTQIQRLRGNKQTAKIAKLRKQLNAFKRRFAEPEQVEPEPSSINLDELIAQAYLRTVSRYPTQSELARSKQYVAEAKDSLDGVRGVLWALLNTKEFIVNH